MFSLYDLDNLMAQVAASHPKEAFEEDELTEEDYKEAVARYFTLYRFLDNLPDGLYAQREARGPEGQTVHEVTVELCVLLRCIPELRFMKEEQPLMAPLADWARTAWKWSGCNDAVLPCTYTDEPSGPTDLKKFRALLDEFGIGYELSTDTFRCGERAATVHELRVEAHKSEKVGGYDGFFTYFVFTVDGQFQEMGVQE